MPSVLSLVWTDLSQVQSELLHLITYASTYSSDRTDACAYGGSSNVFASLNDIFGQFECQ